MIARRHPLPLAVLFVSAVIACDEGEERPPAETPVEIVASTSPRANIRHVGRDTLSMTARVIRLEPEPNGESVAVLFADSVRGVSAGLALHEENTDTVPLLWPDSVTRVWWSGEHRLSFTTATGDGVYVVVNVHEAQATAVQDLGATPPAPPDSTDRALLGRAQQYIDSVRVQPTGVATEGTMTYTVTEMRLDPRRELGAFYVTSRDPGGRELNPGWYVMHLESGRATAIDEIVGDAADLPRAAGGWTDDGRFIYAKGSAIHEARVRVEASP